MHVYTCRHFLVLHIHSTLFLCSQKDNMYAYFWPFLYSSNTLGHTYALMHCFHCCSSSIICTKSNFCTHKHSRNLASTELHNMNICTDNIIFSQNFIQVTICYSQKYCWESVVKPAVQTRTSFTDPGSASGATF